MMSARKANSRMRYVRLPRRTSLCLLKFIQGDWIVQMHCEAPGVRWQRPITSARGLPHSLGDRDGYLMKIRS